VIKRAFDPAGFDPAGFDGGGLDPHAIGAVTFDFGNTLVPVHSAELTEIVARTAACAVSRCRDVDDEAFIRTWTEERDRQLRENLPLMREVDLDQRLVRVLARLRGAIVPGPADRWDDEAVAGYSEPSEIDSVLRAYADAFVDVVPAPPEVGPLLVRLGERWLLGVISNWPLASAIERYLECAGWRERFDVVVVSHAAGSIKPDRRIFDAAAAALGTVESDRLLHVGDDLGADVGGAKGAGWRAAWLRGRPSDSPLPVADATDVPEPDLVLDRLVDLETAMGLGPERGLERRRDHGRPASVLRRP
jgi:FMN phosphatase YigB (HAD superfamily)